MSNTKVKLPLDAILRICYEVKRQGKRIAFTHGAFDLFHLSHLDLLTKSASVCDYLVVGVESDENVRKYKTQKRPINDEESRLSIINELNCVDAAFIIDFESRSDNYTAIYQELNSDFVTIGHKFEYEDVMEEQTRKGGSQLIKLQTRQYPSTTTIINKIVRRHSKNDFMDVSKEE